MVEALAGLGRTLGFSFAAGVNLYATVETIVGLLGGTLAAGTHFTKAGTRAASNASPEPFSNWILSLAEDAFVIGLGVIALKYPVLAAAIVIVGVVLMIVFATWIIRAVRRRWARREPVST